MCSNQRRVYIEHLLFAKMSYLYPTKQMSYNQKFKKALMFFPNGTLPNDYLSLEPPIELLLLLGGLEAPMPKLGRCVDELKLDLLQGHTGSLIQ